MDSRKAMRNWSAPLPTPTEVERITLRFSFTNAVTVSISASEELMNLSRSSAVADTPREFSMVWREATYPSRFPAKVATLSMSWGISMSSRNTKKRMTVMKVSRLERKILILSFLMARNRVRP